MVTMNLQSKATGALHALTSNAPTVLIAGVVAIIAISILGPGFGLLVGGAVIMVVIKGDMGKILGGVAMFSGALTILGSGGAL